MLENGSVSQRETELGLKNKQDMEDIFSAVESQWPGTIWLRIKKCDGLSKACAECGVSPFSPGELPRAEG